MNDYFAEHIDLPGAMYPWPVARQTTLNSVTSAAPVLVAVGRSILRLVAWLRRVQTCETGTTRVLTDSYESSLGA